MGTKRIFIASSGEALPIANSVAEALAALPGVVVEGWWDWFENGDLTFEAIERLVHEIDGAVIIATPDDAAVVKGDDVMVPRTNVMFEYGYLVSFFGRKRVALCVFEPAVLPTDFHGLTHIRCGPAEAAHGNGMPSKSQTTLMHWAAGLPTGPALMPAFCRVHGYSGEWKFKVTFQKWRGLEIEAGEMAEVTGTAFLEFDPNGNTGVGSLYGILEVDVRGCRAVFRLCDEIVRATVSSSGHLSLRSRTFSRQRLSINGQPPQPEGFEEILMENREFEWEMDPSGDRMLKGSYQTEVMGKVYSLASLCFERR